MEHKLKKKKLKIDMFVINNILEMLNFMFDNNELFLVMYAVMIYVNY